MKRKFFIKRTRAAGISSSVNGFVDALRGLIIKGVILLIFIFSLNMVFKYFFEKYNIGFDMSAAMPFAKPKFFIVSGNYYTVYSSGKTVMVESSIDRSPLPVISGIKIKEDRKEYKIIFRKLLELDKKYLSVISEIIVKSPDDIYMITVDGKKIYAGSRLDNGKLENFYIVYNRLEKAGKRWSRADIRFKNKVIIK